MFSKLPGSRLISYLSSGFAVIVLMANVASAQNGPPSGELRGEASVLIFDDFETGESELRYFIINAVTGRDTEVFFQGPVPEHFKTGHIVAVHGQEHAAGFNVNSVQLLDDSASDPSGSEATSAAPLASPETRNVLTLLVDFNDAYVDGPGMTYGISLQEAKDRMYNQTKSVAGLFYNSSLGTLTIPPDPDGDGVQDVFGPYQINDSYIGGDSSQCSPSTWVNLASAAWQDANPDKNIGLYKHRLLIVPNYWDWKNRHCGWGGVAQVGCGSWCWAIGADGDSIFHGVLIHELGHNLGFNHAQTDTDNDGSTNVSYGDGSDMMGVSRSWMKFNAPHAEDKGWVDPVNYEIRAITPSASAQQFDLIAMDEEAWDWPGLRAVKFPRTGNTDYYVSWRTKSGEYNNVNTSMTYGGVTNYFANLINIHHGYDNSTYTYFITSLAVGESFYDSYNDVTVTFLGTMNVSGAAGTTTVATVEICEAACSSIAAPSNLTATAISTSAIDLAWADNSDNEDGFRLEHSLDGSNWGELDTQTGTAYTHGGLATASTHHYRVQAFNASEASGWSNVAVETTAAVPPSASFTWSADYTEVSFSDASTDDGSVVGWDWDFDDGGSSTDQNPVHSYAAAGTYTVGLTVTDNHGATSFTSQPVSVDAPPFQDFWATGESTAGGSVSGSYLDTHADDGGTEAITERESGGKPANRHSWLEHQWTFNITAGALATVYVNAWQDASADGDTFDFSWSANGSSWTDMFNVSVTGDPGSPQSFTLPQGTSGTVYVRVTDTDQSETNRARDTVYVDEIRIRVENGSGTAPDAPSGLTTASAATHDRVELSWTDNSSDETGFRIERKVQGVGSFAEVGQGGQDAAGFTDTSVSAGITYEYRVIAFNASGDSGPSNVLTVTTPAAPNVDIVLTASGFKIKGQHNVDLEWSGNSGNVDIYRDGKPVVGATNVSGSTYPDNIGAKGGATYVYEVCETGSTTACSNEATVTF